MIMPTLLNVRKNSSSSSIAIIGAGALADSTPLFMMAAGSNLAELGSFGLLKLAAGTVPGSPWSIFAMPDSGPKPNRYIWCPSPMVA